MQKVKYFIENSLYDLEERINEFAKSYQILQISYATEKQGYSTYHYCMVLYEV